eukprot:275482_1
MAEQTLSVESPHERDISNTVITHQLSVESPHERDISNTVITHQLSVESPHERDISNTVIINVSDEETVLINTSHGRDITEFLNYDTSTLNKGFQKEIADVFSQFQDDLHAKQNTINEQKKINEELNMTISQLQLNIQEMKKDKKQWQQKTINSIKDMVSEQNTDMILDTVTQSLQLDSTPKSVDELTQSIKLKYDTNNTNNQTDTDTETLSSVKYLLILAIGVSIGYAFKEKIKSIFNP